MTSLDGLATALRERGHTVIDSNERGVKIPYIVLMPSRLAFRGPRKGVSLVVECHLVIAHADDADIAEKAEALIQKLGHDLQTIAEYEWTDPIDEPLSVVGADSALAAALGIRGGDIVVYSPSVTALGTYVPA